MLAGAPHPASRAVATFVAAFLAAQHVHAATIERGPYIQSTTTTSAVLVWRLDASAAAEINYGPTLAYGTTLIQPEALTHAVTLEGLLPHTRYYYRVRVGGQTLADGPQFYLETAPERGPLRVLVFGDSGAEDAMQDSVAAQMVHEDADLMLHTGDIAPRRGLEGSDIYSPEQDETGAFPKTATLSVPAAGESAPAGMADDPAIWVHPEDPARSVVIGTNKGGGVHVFDLQGNSLQYVAGGRPNNVDVRYGFRLGGNSVDLVVAGDRATNKIVVYTIDPETRSLTQVGAIQAGIPTYGCAMYHSRSTGKFYVFVGAEQGVEQWELVDQGDRIGGVLARRFPERSLIEGIVADDELRHLYLAEEKVGIFKYGAEPDQPTTPVATVDDVNSSTPLTADVEGLAIYYCRNGLGYLLVSSQGNDRYLVYRREGNNDYMGSFAVPSARDTDGIDVVNMPLGSPYGHGLFVAQNSDDDFQFARWGDIANGLGLAIDTRGYDVRLANATEHDHDARYYHPFAEILCHTPVYPARGDHHGTPVSSWWDDFHLPPNRYDAAAYSYDWGDAHFVVLDSSDPAPGQASWLAADLAATTKPWKVALMHHPARGCAAGSNDAGRAALLATLETHGVDVVFCGHEPGYQRSDPILGETLAGRLKSSAYVDPAGPIHVVAGGAADANDASANCGFASIVEDRIHYTRMSIAFNTLTLEAVDVRGQVFDRATITKSHLPPNLAPLVSVAALPDSGEAPLLVSFDAGAIDPEGELLQAWWEFGDGAVDSIANPVHTYTAPGTYWARVRVSDPFGATTIDSVRVDVLGPPAPNQPPAVTASVGPQQGVAPHLVVFQAAASDPENGALDYEWSFGDGTTTTTPAGTYLYSKPGWYTTRVTVTDAQGAKATASRLVLVGNPEPANQPPAVSLQASPVTGQSPLEVAFSVEASDPEHEALRYLWSFGDGAVDTVAAPTHRYLSAGQFTARVIVKDARGASASAETVIDVLPPEEQPVVQPVFTRINFQNTGPVPDGYVADTGQLYSDERGYGWIGKTLRAERRNYHPDPRLDTYVYVSNPDSVTWNLALPNGDYVVDVVVGSPQYTGDHRLVVQGELLVDDVHTVKNQFVAVSNHPVQVTDGRLHVQIGGFLGSAFKTKLCYLHVASVGVADEPTDAPLLPMANIVRLMPNPANPSVRIAFALTQEQNVCLDVFDVRGRRIRSLYDGRMPAGDQAIVWNGLDDRGRGVESGVYFVHMRAGQQRHVSKLTIAR